MFQESSKGNDMTTYNKRQMAGLLGMGYQLLTYYLPRIPGVVPNPALTGRDCLYTQEDLRKIACWCSEKFGASDPRKAAADRVLAKLDSEAVYC